MTFQSSKFQQNIYDRASQLQPHQNLMIQARAGSGKTSTIVEVLKQLPPEPAIFLAFNKLIATELAKRVPANVEATTLNSFGWRICLKNLRGHPRLVEDKTVGCLKMLFDRDLKVYYKIRGTIKQLVGLMKAWMFEERYSDKDVYDLIAKYGVEIPEKVNEQDFMRYLQNTWKIVVSQKHSLDFDDQIYVPVAENLTLPAYRYVFVDEAQDLNPVQIELVTRLGRSGSVIAVGDDKQAIYGFRGADPDAMDRLRDNLNAEVLPLSICYRCPKSVIELAQTIVPDIESSPTAADGIVKHTPLDDMRLQWKDDDYVLCRVTAPLVTECLKMIRKGKRACVKGRDIGKNLIDSLDQISKGNTGTLEDAVSIYRSEQLARLERQGKEAFATAVNDKCDTLLAILEDVSTGDGSHDYIAVKNKIESIFSDNLAGTIFSTIHKSKGLEAPRVFILKPELLPHPSAKLPWQVKQEMNLKYVAFTRSQNELYIALPETKGGHKSNSESGSKRTGEGVDSQQEVNNDGNPDGGNGGEAGTVGGRTPESNSAKGTLSTAQTDAISEGILADDEERALFNVEGTITGRKLQSIESLFKPHQLKPEVRSADSQMAEKPSEKPSWGSQTDDLNQPVKLGDCWTEGPLLEIPVLEERVKFEDYQAEDRTKHERVPIKIETITSDDELFKPEKSTLGEDAYEEARNNGLPQTQCEDARERAMYEEAMDSLNSEEPEIVLPKPEPKQYVLRESDDIEMEE